MVELPGELVIDYFPDQPGKWAYRKLPDGALLLVELSKAELSQLHEQSRQKWMDKIRDLDKHPLNAAARVLLESAREHPLGNEISVISLARFALDEDVSSWDDGMMALSDWARSPGTMQKAIWVLEEAEVTPESLLSLALEDAAQLVLEHLG
ncbi:hypothetical protein NSND_61669 [Nitrospira sp. ND1]|uniref:hypothetical protein n=1 Tax=Nitrospira sp. ND1 TaxID=1658518 RepID=UPI0009C67535|nr:hypothetical protein [Nitrospira sp. ND1]SLM44236.1 hypothetical protein NSND_61669 [Nitrospira sp. ND1]